eukprot:768050-Hanusia_phi.AAC.3
MTGWKRREFLDFRGVGWVRYRLGAWRWHHAENPVWARGGVSLRTLRTCDIVGKDCTVVGVQFGIILKGGVGTQNLPDEGPLYGIGSLAKQRRYEGPGPVKRGRARGAVRGMHRDERKVVMAIKEFAKERSRGQRTSIMFQAVVVYT